LATPHDLKVKFNLGLKEADKIYRLSAYAFGPGGKGFDWYVKKIEKILKSKTMNVAVARELVKVAKLFMAVESLPPTKEKINFALQRVMQDHEALKLSIQNLIEMSAKRFCKMNNKWNYNDDPVYEQGKGNVLHTLRKVKDYLDELKKLVGESK